MKFLSCLGVTKISLGNSRTAWRLMDRTTGMCWHATSPSQQRCSLDNFFKHWYLSLDMEYLVLICVYLFFYTEGTNSSWGNVMTGDLPENFLRISPGMTQAPAPGQMIPVQPFTYYQPTAFMQPFQQTPLGRLSITVQQVSVLLE